MFWDIIDNTYIINLRGYTQRLSNTLKELLKVKCSRWSVIEAFDGHGSKYHKDARRSKDKANSYSHGLAIQDAIVKNYNRIIILEDDICFHKSFLQEMDSIKKFTLEENPDVIYFYSKRLYKIYQPFFSLDQMKFIKYTGDKFYGSHFYLLGRKTLQYCADYFSRRVGQSLMTTKDICPTDGLFWYNSKFNIFHLNKDLVYQNTKIPSILNDHFK